MGSYCKTRYSIEPKFWKYVKDYGLKKNLKNTKKFGNIYGKKLMDTATKTWFEDAAKITSRS